VAAGLKVTAFQMLSVDAVVVFEFNPDIRLGIYGVAVFDAPSQQSPVKFAHVELGIVCVLDIQAGVFKVEAQLSPNSFILHPSCHLTGGFALYSWSKSKNDAIAGDWVLTIGGYHQAYNVSTQYPKPPRLGISWSMDAALSITGEAYFAITPNICMGGGRLHAALSLGPLNAYFDAFLDFLINYQPFHFSSIGKISVGVRYAMDMWIVTVRISAEIGATLSIEGPPMAGTVHVDFWVFGFDINFGGSQPRKPPKLTLKQFTDMIFESDSTSGSGFAMTALETLTDDPKKKKKATTKPIIFNCNEGLIPQDKKKDEKKTDDTPEVPEVWVVRGGALSFTITFKFPISDLKLEDGRDANGPSKPSVGITRGCMYMRSVERR
jgi:hypothetical protein